MTMQANLTIAPNGRLVIPANMRAELGLQGGIGSSPGWWMGQSCLSRWMR
jgi:hypothetical protein